MVIPKFGPRKFFSVSQKKLGAKSPLMDSWQLTDFQRKRQEAIAGRTTSIYSPPFYTSKTGRPYFCCWSHLLCL